MAKRVYDQHFRTFAKSLEMAIMSVGDEKTQKNQVEDLIKLETKFRKELNSHAAGREVYKKFIKYILEDKKNILSARPFFRERQKKFSAEISPAFKEKDHKAFQRFRFNYTFILFALKVYKGRRKIRLQRMADEIAKERDSLIKKNIPLSINRAKIFWKKVPKVNHEYMDYIQMAAEGLISAVDKFVPPYRTVFRSVAIGRMVGNMVEASSETLLHFYPSDKRELYKANLLRHRRKIEKIEDIVREMNKEREDKDKITSGRLYNIIRGASHVSMDAAPVSKKDDDLELITVHSRIADDTPNQEEMYEQIDTVNKIKDIFDISLSLIQKKIFILKGEMPHD